MKSRPAKVLDDGTWKKLFKSLDGYAEREGAVGYRTRAFAYLLADGALRSGSAVSLDIEEVAPDPGVPLKVVAKVKMRKSEATKYQERTIAVSERARGAIAEYLEAARKAGWLADPERATGPLFIASTRAAPGSQPRLTQRGAIEAWHAFLESDPEIDPDTQMDDLVLTGRVRYVEAGASRELLSEHAGVNLSTAALISEHSTSRPGTTSDVLAHLESTHKRRAPRAPAAPLSAQAAAQPAPAPVQTSPGTTPAPDVFDQIRKLGELRDAKFLTDAQFEEKKRELLARI